MSNYKIRVNSEAESKEAQELFFELGYEKGVCSTGDYPALIIATPESRFQKTPYSSRATSLNHEAHSQYKEITLPELRDMVVLKRNKVGDATHTDGRYSFYVGKDKNYFFSSCDKAWRGTWKNVDILKPIEKPMKEYLRKNSNGTYSYIGTVRPEHVSDFMIEIPEGCNIITCENRKGNLVYFHWKSLDSDEFFLKDEKIWSNNFNETLSDFIEKNEGDVKIIWSRHTHPEELPFIDDEPKIETETRSRLDQVAKNNDLRERYFGETSEDYRYWLEQRISRKEPSLNDQYAEIEKVRQSHRTASETADPTIKETLSQRQEQYGSFEDVAMFTEQMIDVMRKGYYEKLAYNQKMALYMICSKMARIVNGNPNHKDSWHDIAGYATLIDNELVSEKDMPF